MLIVCILIYLLCALVRAGWFSDLIGELGSRALREKGPAKWYLFFNPISVIFNPRFWLHWSPDWYEAYLKKRYPDEST